MNITTALLRAADSSNSEEYYESIAGPMTACASSYGVDTPLRIAHFLAQIAHESSLRIVEENGSYSAKRMRQIFGCRGGSDNYDAAADDCKRGRLREKLWTEAAKYAQNAESLLSYVYSSRLGNGDEASGDGFRYRGRGMIQLTGKINYAKFSSAHTAKNPADPRDFVAHPELVSDRALPYGVESAYFFWDAHSLNAIADSDDVVAVTKAVNGGLIGLPDRQARLERVKKELRI